MTVIQVCIIIYVIIALNQQLQNRSDNDTKILTPVFYLQLMKKWITIAASQSSLLPFFFFVFFLSA